MFNGMARAAVVTQGLYPYANEARKCFLFYHRLFINSDNEGTLSLQGRPTIHITKQSKQVVVINPDLCLCLKQNSIV